MTVKTQYSDEELEEFRAIINEKIAIARQSYDEMIRQLMNADSNDVDDTVPHATLSVASKQMRKK